MLRLCEDKSEIRVDLDPNSEDARGDGGEDVPRDGTCKPGVLFGRDRLGVLVTQKNGFVVRGGVGDIGDVDDSLVHGDAADDGGAVSADEDRAAIGEGAAEAVRVTDSEEGDLHGFGGDEGAVVADLISGSQSAKADDAGFPGEYRFETVAQGGNGRWLGGAEFRSEAVKGKAGAEHGIEIVTVAECGQFLWDFSGEGGGGVADVEPGGVMAAGADLGDEGFELLELGGGGLAIGFVGGVEVGHQAIETEGRSGVEAGQDGFEFREGDALAAHAGVEFEMNGNGMRRGECGVGGRFEFVELIVGPDDGGDATGENFGALAGERAADG